MHKDLQKETVVVQKNSENSDKVENNNPSQRTSNETRYRDIVVKEELEEKIQQNTKKKEGVQLKNSCSKLSPKKTQEKHFFLDNSSRASKRLLPDFSNIKKYRVFKKMSAPINGECSLVAKKEKKAICQKQTLAHSTGQHVKLMRANSKEREYFSHENKTPNGVINSSSNLSETQNGSGKERQELKKTKETDVISKILDELKRKRFSKNLSLKSLTKNEGFKRTSDEGSVNQVPQILPTTLRKTQKSPSEKKALEYQASTKRDSSKMHDYYEILNEKIEKEPLYDVRKTYTS